MYGIFTNIYPINGPNVDKYTIHGSYGKDPGTDFPRALLSDFGTAQAFGEPPASATAAQSRGYTGTVEYTAPELLFRSEDLGGMYPLVNHRKTTETIGNHRKMLI